MKETFDYAKAVEELEAIREQHKHDSRTENEEKAKREADERKAREEEERRRAQPVFITKHAKLIFRRSVDLNVIKRIKEKIESSYFSTASDGCV